ncbi:MULTISPECIES: ABC transporter ATP-binding protein [unclassified Sphingobacterium]|uniref:ABC transporter ATP-binding protein n=1 Tax=unclassified Sphingobacterium TaxID=2609468 RepID=UPI0020C4162C|nr:MULTISPECIES: ABC transporter ATP-binding protein [unclassified Sphingobacterium]
MLAGITYQLKWAWEQAKGHKNELIVFFILELIGIACSLYFVVWSKHAIDFAISGDKASVDKALILTVLFIVLGLIVKAWGSWINERTRAKMLIEVQNKLIKIQMLSRWKVIKNWHTGDMQIRINNDANEIVQMIGFSFISFLITVIKLLASFALLWSMDPMLALLILAISPLFIFTKIYFKKLRFINRSLKKAESNLGKVVQENLRFRMVLRALGLQNFRWQKVEESQANIYDLKLKLLNFSTISQSSLKLLINIGFLLTFVWGVYKLRTDEITFGMMTAFLQLVGRIQGPLLLLMSFIPVFIKFRTAAERVEEVYKTEVEEEYTPEFIKDPYELIIKNLSFKYEDNLVIDDFNLKVKKGEPTAIIGSSGKGKTTLIRLLLAVIQPNKGEIYVETGLKTYAINHNHRVNIAYVPQGDKLFSGTIKENILTDTENVNPEKIYEVLYLSCSEFVYDLPDGLDTVVGESGYGLSEGQAQRIALARALMKENSIWLFDEVTSALDHKTSELLIERLMSAAKNKIVIFVTHDLKLAEKCSQSVYMQ